MSKKKKIIIIVSIVIAFYAIFGGAYLYLLHLEDEGLKALFTEDAMTYLNSNDDFTSEYGEVISLTSEDKIPIEADDGVHYMTFHCVTTQQELIVRVYSVYDEGRIYYYEIK
ncbi:MAG: hypothetical protein IJW97_00450 [Clostridia bacterium]|nr:hypothetical protein [Clostridia bacterium]